MSRVRCGSALEFQDTDTVLRLVRNDLDYLAYDWDLESWRPVEKPKNALQFDQPDPNSPVDPTRSGGEMSTYLRSHLDHHGVQPAALASWRWPDGLVFEAVVASLSALGLTVESTPDGATPPDCAHMSCHRPALSGSDRKTLYNRLSKTMALVSGSPPPAPPTDSQ